jgi:methylmalonyl-CoA mutase
VRAGIAAGLDVDAFAPRLSFFFCVGMGFFMEVAKLRAARLLWALMAQLGPQDERSLSLRTHCQTSGWSLTAQDPYNNVVRTLVEAMAATLGGTQSLHTNAFDEALALPSDRSARIARNTQLFLQHETSTCALIDPWGGSWYVERLTHDLANRALEHIAEVEAEGGMAAAIEAGIPKLRIEESAARTRRASTRASRWWSASTVPAGLRGARRAAPGRQQRGARAPDRAPRTAPPGARRRRGARFARSALPLRRDRRGQPAGALHRGRARARHGRRDQRRPRARLGSPRRRSATQGVYRSALGGEHGKQTMSDIQRRIEEFEEREGRRPRILVVKIGQDGHDRGQKVIASAFADLGFDVDVGPLFQTPAEVARQAVENDVHVVGVSSLAAGHLTLVPQLEAELAALGRGDIAIVVGGVIPPHDHDKLLAAGALAIFPPGTVIGEAAARLLDLLAERDARA